MILIFEDEANLSSHYSVDMIERDKYTIWIKGTFAF